MERDNFVHLGTLTFAERDTTENAPGECGARGRVTFNHKLVTCPACQALPCWGELHDVLWAGVQCPCHPLGLSK